MEPDRGRCTAIYQVSHKICLTTTGEASPSPPPPPHTYRVEVVVDVGSVAGVGRLEGPRNRDSRRRSGATAAFDLDLSAGDVPLGS